MASTSALPQIQPRRVLVVGGGAAGLASLRALVQPDPGSSSIPFDHVTLVERRKEVGGVWYLDPEAVRAEASLPRGTSDGQWPVRVSPDSAPLWPSPAYPALRGNVLPRFLSFSGLPFPAPANGKTFPTLDETGEYLLSVARPLRKHIRCNVEVEGVWELPPTRDGKPGGWKVRTLDWNQGGKADESHWDAVVIANGWYDQPIYPPVPGLDAAVKAGKVHHAKWYRTPSIYRNERIVVCGNGNSANDAAAHLAQQRVKGKDEVVYRSIKCAPCHLFASLPDERIKDVAAISRYEVSAGGSRMDLTLEDGSRIENVDRVLLGTGYAVGTIPFLHLLDEEEEKQRKARNADEDWPDRVRGLWAHMLLARNPTLAFNGLSVSYTPFVLADLQGWLLRSVWDGAYSLPSSLADRLVEERERIALLRSRRERIGAVEKDLFEQWKAAKARGDADVPAAPEGVTFFTHYHMLAQERDEMEHAARVRARAVEAKPWLEGKLQRWDDEEREEARAGMYERKRLTLLRHRKIREEQESTAREGKGRNGSGASAGQATALKGHL